VLVTAKVTGLLRDGFYAFHIHEGGSCGENDFRGSGMHYNPTGAAHPDHAGDLPPLLSHNGKARMSVLTGRFRVDEIIGTTVIIHANPDDFTTQPSGNPGEKLACGVICRD
jgi:Cu-Zn family superoxide dismutase